MTTSESGHVNRWHGWLVLLVVFLLSLGLRWYYVSHAVVLNPVRGDATQYYTYALNLANHGTFSKDIPSADFIHPDNYRDPGYPLFLALWMKMLGTGDAWYAAVLVCQALLGALTATLATQLGRHWLPLRWAAAAGVAMALWPHSITINGYLLSETLFGFLGVVGILATASALQRQSAWLAATAGLVLGSAALTNAVLLPFGPLLALFLWWRRFAPGKICIALVIGVLILPGAWAIRNAMIVAPVSGNSSVDRAMLNFAQGSRPVFQSAWRESVLGSAAEKNYAQKEIQAVNDDYQSMKDAPVKAAKSILQRFLAHPLKYGRWYLVDKPALFWGWSIEIGQGDIFVYPTKNAPFQIKPAWIALAAISHSVNTPLMLLALASLILTWSRKHQWFRPGWQASRATLILVMCATAFVTVVYTTLQAEPRYSIPFRPFEILLAITSLWSCATWWKETRLLRSDAPESVGANADG